MKRTCFITGVFVSVIFIGLLLYGYYQLTKDYVPPLRFQGVSAERILYCHNPPGFKGEGSAFVIYQLHPLNAQRWVQEENRDPKDRAARPITGTKWIRGPITNPKYVKAFEYLSSRNNARERFPWKSWVKSDSTYFHFERLEESSIGFSDATIWVLDGRTDRLYLLDVNV